MRLHKCLGRVRVDPLFPKKSFSSYLKTRVPVPPRITSSRAVRGCFRGG